MGNGDLRVVCRVPSIVGSHGKDGNTFALMGHRDIGDESHRRIVTDSEIFPM